MPRIKPPHRAALSAALTVPIAAGALVLSSGAAHAVGAEDGTRSAEAADTAASSDAGTSLPTAALLRPDGREALPPEYVDVRSVLPSAEVAPAELSPQPGLAVSDGMELEPRTTAPSRSSLRDAAGPELGRVKVADKRWALKEANVRSGPGKRFDVVTTLDFRDGIGFTGLRSGPWLQVKRQGESLWLNRDLVSPNRPPKPKPKPKPKPAPAPTASPSSPRTSTPARAAAPAPAQRSAPAPKPAPAPAPTGCTNGTSVSGGANVLAVHRAVCATFPSITTYGTYRANSANHASGRAIDVMVSGSTGYAVADYVRANAGSLGVSEVIYAQRIWTVQRASEGWRSMSSRGSATADHYDHVHVSTY